MCIRDRATGTGLIAKQIVNAAAHIEATDASAEMIAEAKRDNQMCIRDRTGALVGLSRAVDNAPDANEGTWRLMIEGLFTTVTNVSFNEKTIRELIDRVHEEKARLVPGCSGCGSRCGRNDDYDMNLLWNAQEDIRSLKSLILFGVRGMAAYAHHAMMLGYADEKVNRFFAKALFAVGEDWDMDALLPIVMEVGEKNLQDVYKRQVGGRAIGT